MENSTVDKAAIEQAVVESGAIQLSQLPWGLLLIGAIAFIMFILVRDLIK